MSICLAAMHHPVDHDDPGAGFVYEEDAPVSDAKPQIPPVPSFQSPDVSCSRSRMTVDGFRDTPPGRLVEASQVANRPGVYETGLVRARVPARPHPHQSAARP